MIVERIYPPTKGEKTDEKDNSFVSYDDMQLMAWEAQCSIQSLKLKNFHYR